MTSSFWICLEVAGYYPKLKSYKAITEGHISLFMPPSVACNFLVWGSNLPLLSRSCQPNVWGIKVYNTTWVVVVDFCPQLPPFCGGSVIFMVYREWFVLLYRLLVGPTRSTYHVFLCMRYVKFLRTYAVLMRWGWGEIVRCFKLLYSKYLQ